jgi:hypothetical protein
MVAPQFLSETRRRVPSIARLALLALLAGFAVACATGVGPRLSRTQPLRISEVAGHGDATRRASTRLVLNGLESSPPERGLFDYERAIQIDPTNPYAYLAFAAFEIQWGDLEQGVQLLAQSELLLESEGLKSPRVEPHLIGLRGRSMLRGYDDVERRAGESWLDEARRMAPEVWGDGWLGVAELR